MLIDGYEDDPLVAGEELISRPGFWAAYLMWMCGADEAGDPAPEWFGADAADADAACEALMDEEAWPVFRVPFSGGHSAVVVGRNFPDDRGTEYFVTHPGWGRRGYLATVDGHQAGPGLSWRELIHVANTPDHEAPGVHDPHARLLLLLPVLGDDGAPVDAAGVVGEALVRVGAPVGEAVRVAALLLDHPLWDAAHWSLPGESPLSGGGVSFGGILQCDGPGSPRSGMQLARGISPDQSERLARALGTWPA
ncbi:hypothetical protein GCM10018790_75680 [Kitasatospora xanthocidica]|uniref:hypothetical protein n=1 Tax=Kitasatospora xanthocidica TaxID=83382 RepID=UPI00167A6968|nr:hypothetical protein [Kitasatospora xanthocidica]GHF87025.1 hypothetical protein GCM10018790_75680 [Kitasatospora xanthocidica]